MLTASRSPGGLATSLLPEFARREPKEIENHKAGSKAGGSSAPGDNRPRLAYMSRHEPLQRPFFRRTDDGLDRKSIDFNILKKRVCMECTRPFYFSLLSVAAQGVDSCRQAAPRRPIAVTWTWMCDGWRTDLRLYDSNLAKVGVEGSNPFARSKFPQI